MIFHELLMIVVHDIHLSIDVPLKQGGGKLEAVGRKGYQGEDEAHRVG